MPILKSKNHLIWLDMEMTGLDPQKDKILEMATVITDNELNIVATGPDLVIYQNPKVLRAMNSWCQKQHKRSGLLKLVRQSKISAREAEKKTLHFFKKHCHAGHSPLCGNSIHHDRKFLVKFMPSLDRFIHYRHIDVSTLKELCYRWRPRTPKGPAKKETHRALDDILESIEELKFYKKHLFR